MNHPEEANPWRRKMDRYLPGDGRKEEWLFAGYSMFLCDDVNFATRERGWNMINILKTTDLFNRVNYVIFSFYQKKKSYLCYKIASCIHIGIKQIFWETQASCPFLCSQCRATRIQTFVFVSKALPQFAWCHHQLIGWNPSFYLRGMFADISFRKCRRREMDDREGKERRRIGSSRGKLASC